MMRVIQVSSLHMYMAAFLNILFATHYLFPDYYILCEYIFVDGESFSHCLLQQQGQ